MVLIEFLMTIRSFNGEVDDVPNPQEKLLLVWLRPLGHLQKLPTERRYYNISGYGTSLLLI